MSVKGFDMFQEFLAVAAIVDCCFWRIELVGERSSVELFFFALDQLHESHFQFGLLAIALETQNKIVRIITVNII